MKPIFRWAGSKRYLADTLIPRFPTDFGKYIEPFCGSASLFFLLEPPIAILGDINSDLINALGQIRRSPTLLAQICQDLPDSEEDYYLLRTLLPANLDVTSRAARFLHLNRLCFNGLYRTNKQGLFNVPYSGRRIPPPASAAHYRAAARLLKRATLILGRHEITLRSAAKGDFIYLDPPYATEGNGHFIEYDSGTFRKTELSDLRQSLKTIHQKGAKFMLSYAMCKEISGIANDWNATVVLARRNIAGFAGFRKRAEEVIVTNY